MPEPLPLTQRYRGHTSSVSIEVAGQSPLLLDLGTGLVLMGCSPEMQDGFEGTALVTHLHFDHVLGLPFFVPVNRPGTRLDIVGPPQPGGSLADALASLIRPPISRSTCAIFEVTPASPRLPRIVRCRGAAGDIPVIPHVGATLGYRIEFAGNVVSYINAHQAPGALEGVADGGLELCDGADLLVHDAQHTPKGDWGHSTADYAVLIAREAGVRQLCLFHHDPAQSDDDVDRMLDSVRLAAEAAGLAVVAAAEDLVVTL